MRAIDDAQNSYRRFHGERIERTLSLLRKLGARRVVEIGGHPWALAERLIAEPDIELVATVSAEETTLWPDDIGVTRELVELRDCQGHIVRTTNYRANIERTRFDIEGRPDTVLACEVIEHLIRSPHVMMLNINAWLPIGGHVVMTTPNGCQFMNPLRRRPRMPGYRARVYERHAYVYSLHGLIDLVMKSGFDIQLCGCWDVYPRSGTASLYGLLARIPLDYFREKFSSTLFLVARKSASLDRLPSLPEVYVPSPDWERVADQKRGASVTDA